MLGFGLWGRMAKHFKHGSLACLAGRDTGVSDSATQGLGGPERGLISERFECGSTGDDAPGPPPLVVLHPTQDPIPDGNVDSNRSLLSTRAQIPQLFRHLLSCHAYQPALAETHPVLVLCRAGLACAGCWMLGAGCWMLDVGLLTAWAKESVWVLGSLISPAVVHTIMCLPTS